MKLKKTLKKTKYSAEKALFYCPYLLALFAIFMISTISGCQLQNEQETKQDNLTGYLVQTFPKQQRTKKINLSLFEEKCSVCHSPDRALTVFKDPEVWEETIKRMQYYSKGEISDNHAKDLVDFHISRQQSEIDTFQETCTKCHDDERINNRSMSPEQWQATIKRMQQKVPELISDEKVIILSSYFHRRELSMARIFHDKCPLCHVKSSEITLNQAFDQQTTNLIVMASQEFGGSLQIRKFRSLQASHIERQKRNMQLYESDCQICHVVGLPNEQVDSIDSQGKRTRSEWVFFIVSLQKIELTKEIQKSINSQIELHISRH
jgi:hypothetical protein